MRDTRRELRLAATEAEAIEIAAERAGLRVADWIRVACLDRARGEGAVARVNEGMAAELAALRARVDELERRDGPAAPGEDTP